MDGTNGYRIICHNTEAASRPQIGWPRFSVEERRNMVEIRAQFADPLPGHL